MTIRTADSDTDTADGLLDLASDHVTNAMKMLRQAEGKLKADNCNRAAGQAYQIMSRLVGISNEIGGIDLTK